jgi:hypothetical protein
VIHRSPFPDAAIPDQTLTEYVFANADSCAAKAAVIEGPTGRAVSYAVLVESIRRLGGGLVSSGFGPGKVLAIMAPIFPSTRWRSTGRPGREVP